MKRATTNTIVIATFLLCTVGCNAILGNDDLILVKDSGTDSTSLRDGYDDQLNDENGPKDASLDRASADTTLTDAASTLPDAKSDAPADANADADANTDADATIPGDAGNQPPTGLRCPEDASACVGGGIFSTGHVPDPSGSGPSPGSGIITLTDDGFELGETQCNTTGTICVTGAITP